MKKNHFIHAHSNVPTLDRRQLMKHFAQASMIGAFPLASACSDSGSQSQTNQSDAQNQTNDQNPMANQTTDSMMADQFMSDEERLDRAMDSMMEVPPLSVDPSKPWWLQDNFAPVEETEATDLPVTGSIPSALHGTYIRNGSNPSSGESTHWFFGDGMVHGVRIENQTAKWYRNRYIQTPLLQGDNSVPSGGHNTSNVSAFFHADRLLTSGEIGFPYQLNPDDLSTIGTVDFEGQLQTSFTAHPKIDPNTGYMHAFGYYFFAPYLTYYVIDETGAMIHQEIIAVEKPTMVHSFAITDQDVIFWECPVVFNFEAARQGADNPFEWQPEYGARLGIMPLGGSNADLKWVEIDPCYVFHEVNAYRNQDQIILDVCRHATAFSQYEFSENGDLFTVSRWTINMSSETPTVHRDVVLDMQVELPTHDRRFSGRAYRYGWFVQNRPHPQTVDFGGLVQIDYQSGDMTFWDPGLAYHASEAFFVPDSPQAAEGEGWLLTYLYNHVTQKSTLAIFNAQNIATGPVAEIQLPQRVPFGFHGIWIPSMNS